MNANDTDASCSRLQSDRLIKIYVGQDSTKPYLVLQSVLEDLSDYFASAIKHACQLGGEDGMLLFPADDEKTWRVFLYWVVKREVHIDVVPDTPQPHTGNSKMTRDVNDAEDSRADSHEWSCAHQLLLVRCWMFGDRYNVPAYQDVVMLELLHSLWTCGPDLATMQEAFHGTPPLSKLRKVIAEEIYDIMKAGCFDDDESDEYDQIRGLASALARVVEDTSELDSSRVPTQDKPLESTWKNYMIGEPPQQHWVYLEGGKSNENHRSLQLRGDNKGEEL